MVATVAVVGCGHVGLVTAAGLAHLGHQVTGVDIKEELVARLQRGIVDIHEPGLPELVGEGVSSGRLTFVTSFTEGLRGAEYVYLCVDTPQTIAGAADLRSLRAAIASIAEALDGTNPIIVNKSTSPVGTGETIEELLGPALVSRGHQPRIVSNPEFLRQGSAVADFLKPDRIVVGSRDRHAAIDVAELTAALDPGEVIVTSLRTAELIKYVANAFLATRVSFINEVARLCAAIGANVDDVVDGIADDPRIGRAMFTPGIGYGGSCLPKDVAALRYTADAYGVPTPLLGAVEQVNVAAKTALVRRLRTALGSLAGKRIGVWGLTFKGGTEDTRVSPAMDVVELIRNEGADVLVYDPAVSLNSGLAPYTYRAIIRRLPYDAAHGAEALLVLSDWPWDVDWSEVAERMAGRLVFDGRNCLDAIAVAEAGLEYRGVGR